MYIVNIETSFLIFNSRAFDGKRLASSRWIVLAEKSNGWMDRWELEGWSKRRRKLKKIDRGGYGIR